MTSFQKLVQRFAASKALSGTEPWLPQNDIWLTGWQDFDIEYRRKKIDQCLQALPSAYRKAYGKKLRDNMETLKRGLHEEYVAETSEGADESFIASKVADWVSVMVDAVLNWSDQSIEDPHAHSFRSAELKRFMVVVRDFYTTFTDAYNDLRKSGVNLPEKIDELPPLVTFSSTRVWGPHTINADKVQELIQARVGVVSLPSVYATVPLLWVPIAHEVFGHDISHALGQRTCVHLVPDIVTQLQDSVAHSKTIAAELQPTWQKWTEELAADVFGLLSMGPYFAISLAALMSATACSDPFGPRWTPGVVRAMLVARDGYAYDEHPPDLLRLHALVSAAEAVPMCSSSVEELKKVMKEVQPPSCTVDVYDFDSQNVLMRYHWDKLIHDAGQMGRLVITEKLAALGNKPITAFRAWNDADDARAEDIKLQAAKFALNGRGPRLPKGANAAHLLAGATMAAYDDPDAFDPITAFLNRALDEAAAKDKHLR